MQVHIVLTTAGADVGPFDIQQWVNPNWILVATGVSRNTLVTGTDYTVDDNATIIKIQSTGLCTNYLNLVIGTTTTTTTIPPTTTTTTTIPGTTTTTTTVPGTTTTTTTIPSTTTTTTTGDPVTTTTTTTEDPGTTTTTTTDTPTTTTTTTIIPAMVYVDNTLSTDMIITDVQVNGVSIVGASFPVTQGNSTSGTTPATGVDIPITVQYTFTANGQAVSIPGAAPTCQLVEAGSPLSSVITINSGNNIYVTTYSAGCPTTTTTTTLP